MGSERRTQPTPAAGTVEGDRLVRVEPMSVRNLSCLQGQHGRTDLRIAVEDELHAARPVLLSDEVLYSQQPPERPSQADLLKHLTLSRIRGRLV